MQFICQLDDPHFRKSHKSSSFALLPTEVSISFLLINSEEKFNVRDPVKQSRSKFSREMSKKNCDGT